MLNSTTRDSGHGGLDQGGFKYHSSDLAPLNLEFKIESSRVWQVLAIEPLQLKQSRKKPPDSHYQGHRSNLVSVLSQALSQFPPILLIYAKQSLLLFYPSPVSKSTRQLLKTFSYTSASLTLTSQGGGNVGRDLPYYLKEITEVGEVPSSQSRSSNRVKHSLRTTCNQNVGYSYR